MPTLCTTTTGDAELIAAPASGFIRVLGFQITSAANVGRVTLKSAATVKTGVSSFSDSGGGICCPPTALGYFDCTAAQALNISQVGVGTVDITVQYAIYGN
jgi:hypothetical protein